MSLFSVDASDYLKQAELEEEVFGPSTLVVCCDDSAQLLAISNSLGGHLSAALFCEDKDQNLASQ